ncbi:MAG: class I SAM-dependent methyltransferase [Bacteroidota bacterium]|jgi:cyclopropane fatty-acyl-phospholipid synthase-like methyltransferase
MPALASEMNDIYGRMSLHEIPWNIEAPPAELVALVEGHVLLPGKAIDLGCGAGNYSRYLAQKGFDVTGVDLSSEAIKIASARAVAEGLQCGFINVDLTDDLSPGFLSGFDFAFEWQILHHIYPEQRAKYIANVHKLLKPGGKYLAACFHEEDKTFEGSGKYRRTRIGTLLYFSDEKELRALYSEQFRILELKVIHIQGKHGEHTMNYAWMEKK